MPETLRQLISRGPVDASIALCILEQLLNSLEFIHWRGAVHGRIAPEGIVLSTERRGVRARFSNSPAGADGSAAPDGTDLLALEYAAPEQIEGAPADARSDIFVLAVVAYEMFTGRHPYGAAADLSDSALQERILRRSPLDMPQAILASLPAHIPQVLKVALAKDPRERFPSALSFLEALKATAATGEGDVATDAANTNVALQPLSTAGRPFSSQRTSPGRFGGGRRWLIYAAAGVGAVVVLAGALVFALNEAAGVTETTVVDSTTSSILTTTTTIAPTTTTTVAPWPTTTVLATTATATLERYEEFDPRLVYSGDWATRIDDAASGSNFSVTNSSAASVTVTFEGTYLAWIARRSSDCGWAEVTLDGKTLGVIDLYSDGTSTGWQQKVWGSGKLKPGVHTVTISCTGDKNPAATDTDISVDAFDVLGVLIDR